MGSMMLKVTFPSDSGTTSVTTANQELQDIQCPHDGIPNGEADERERGALIPFNPVPLDPASSIITLSQGIEEIPEFNDCQRFVVNGAAGLQYGPLVAIFARNRLDLVFQQQPADGVGVAVATVISWDRLQPNYVDLGIRLGVNCLYMVRKGTQWKAFFTYNGANAACKPQVLIPDPLALDALEVRENPFPSGFTPDDIPPVARWDWDVRNKKQYIVIRCANSMCDIGKPGFTQSPALTPPPQFANSRVFRIKGWYDRQLLAVRNGNTLVPGQLGVIVPYPELDSYSDSNFRAASSMVTTGSRGAGSSGSIAKGIPVAFLYVDGTSYDNPKNWNLNAGMPPRITNVMVSWAPNPALPGWRGRVHHAPAGTSTMTALSLLTWASTALTSVTFRPTHFTGPAPHIPGTTRWRWESTDETTWFRCPLGCCESN